MNVARTATPRRPFHPDVVAFAGEVGGSGPVAVVGGDTASTIGGAPSTGARRVRAPVGIRSVDVAEMTVRVGAGTLVEDLDAALAEVGQEVALGGRLGGTVGGALAVGWSNLRRPRLGPVRDVLLEADVVDAGGRLVRCGGPTVKNVTGYDLCRLLVGSLGILACIGEVVLRTRPRPAVGRWTVGDIDPAVIAGTHLAPSCHLWDGESRWLLHEGHPDDVAAAASALETAGGRATDGQTELPPHRWSVDPGVVAAHIRQAERPVVAEVGVGTLHCNTPQPRRDLAPAARAVHDRMVDLFDPTRRLNPGRDPLDV